MGLRYRVRIPRGIGARWAAIHKRRAAAAQDDGEGVTFRVADLGDGRVPKRSTVAAEPMPQEDDLGLDGLQRDEVLASIAAAERAQQPDRLPVVVALVVVVLVLVFSSGILQGAFRDARERLIERRIKRPRAGMSWRHRHGVSREELGLPPNAAPRSKWLPKPENKAP